MDYTDLEKYLKGCYGESKVRHYLRKVSDSVVLSNFVIPGVAGDIDQIVITNRGIFGVEVKNWKGWIHAREHDWSVVWRKGVRYEIDSLSKQIRNKAGQLSKYIEENTGIANQYVHPVIVLNNEFNPRNIIDCPVDVLRPDQIASYIQRKSFGNKLDQDVKDLLLDTNSRQTELLLPMVLGKHQYN